MKEIKQSNKWNKLFFSYWVIFFIQENENSRFLIVNEKENILHAIPCTLYSSEMK